MVVDLNLLGTVGDLYCFCNTLSMLVYFRSANLILNLFSLMIDANIPDIALEPDKAVKKVHKHYTFPILP